MTTKTFRFIPFSLADIVAELTQNEDTHDQNISLISISRLIMDLYHYQFHRQLDRLKICYAPFDPDSDTLTITPSKTPSSDAHNELKTQLEELLDKGNFERITEQALEEALAEESLFKIRLQVDFNDFEDVLFYGRGETIRTEQTKTWFGLRKKSLSFTNFERVAMFLRFKDNAYFVQNKKSSTQFEPGTTVLKLFRNVPKADLEMLFPNTQVRMKVFDKLLIGIPAIVSGGVVVSTKLGTTLLLTGSLASFVLGFKSEPVVLDQTALIGLGAGLAALAGYLWKQYSTFKNRKLHFMKTLTENLYFKNLDNNAGVFHKLINDAEEEECKEAIMAYIFLSRCSEPISHIELDNMIEDWLLSKGKKAVDFEIHDAMDKLKKLKLATQTEKGWQAIPPHEAHQELLQQWMSLPAT